jgi:hypothetical protein
MNNFQETIPTERGIIIAKLYHNMWYDSSRFAIIMNLLNKWEKDPIREAKFLHEVQEATNTNDLI